MTPPQPLRYHWIRLRASCHPTEDLAKVEAAVRFVSGQDADKFTPQVTPLESHHGGTVQLVECVLDKSRQVRDLLQRLFDLPDARANLKATLESRTDDDGVFFARVDKQDALAGKLTLTRGEDCVQLRLKLEHYPSTRDAAIAALTRLLEVSKV
ncbi:MAG: RNA-binding domain-containing protein [Candidatus Thermoplasmatota archaeon]